MYSLGVPESTGRVRMPLASIAFDQQGKIGKPPFGPTYTFLVLSGLWDPDHLAAVWAQAYVTPVSLAVRCTTICHQRKSSQYTGRRSGTWQSAVTADAASAPQPLCWCINGAFASAMKLLTIGPRIQTQALRPTDVS